MMDGNDETAAIAAATSEGNSGNVILTVDSSSSSSSSLQHAAAVAATHDGIDNSAMAAIKLSPDEDGSRSSGSPSTTTTATTKDYTLLQIKDVTDYSRDTPVEIEPDSPTEGLLRGWSQEEDDDNDGNQNDNDGINREKALKALKKGAVAVTGTALVVAGIPLIPMPTPGGVIVSGSGLALLATEFPAAQRVLDKGRDGLEKMVGEEGDDDDDDDDEEESNPRNKKGYAKIGSFRSLRDTNIDGECLNGADDETASVRSTRSANTRERVDEILKATKKAGKRTKKNAKKFVRGTVLPLMAKITTDKEEASDAGSTSSTSPTKNVSFFGRKGSPRTISLRKKNDKQTTPRSRNNSSTSSTSFPVAIPSESDGI